MTPYRCVSWYYEPSPISVGPWNSSTCIRSCMVEREWDSGRERERERGLFFALGVVCTVFGLVNEVVSLLRTFISHLSFVFLAWSHSHCIVNTLHLCSWREHTHTALWTHCICVPGVNILTLHCEHTAFVFLAWTHSHSHCIVNTLHFVFLAWTHCIVNTLHLCSWREHTALWVCSWCEHTLTMQCQLLYFGSRHATD